MIIYQSTKAGFLDDAFGHDIETVVLGAYRSRTGRRVAGAEIRAWKESLLAMAKVLRHGSIPDDCGIAIEYVIPQSSKRIDLLMSGHDDQDRRKLIIIELKQWETAARTDKDGLVRTRFAGGEAETSHPSYQAWSYAELLRGFNEEVYSNDIPMQPCAYLHNLVDGAVLNDPVYQPYVEKAPVFLSGQDERERLRAYIARHIRRGDRGRLIVSIEGGRIRPSRRLADALPGMMQGKREFVLIDDQKVAFETIVSAAVAGADGRKRVIIVDGGPGTGKSVVAINLLVTLIARQMLAKYVTKNRAPRAVFEQSLTGAYRRTEFASLFAGSGEFIETPADTFDALIVDEAHRLNEKSGLYANLGNNQIEEIIRAARLSVFFIDEDQRVTWKDIGRKAEIESQARQAGAIVTHLKLESQFRCAGSDGYLAWLDQVLGIRETANPILGPDEFDFRVLDSPNEVRRLIEEKNRVANRARMVAGYCWDWKSKKDPGAADVVIPEHGFAMTWNLAQDGGLWITAEHSVEQIGCIHTCQGLEVDYIGVIVGPDLVVHDGDLVARPEKRSRQDQSIKGYKKAFQAEPEEARRKADAIIRNTYRTLMTRGMKGCFVYFSDAASAEYFRARMAYCQEARDPLSGLRMVAEKAND
ncbi:MAG: DUF2075 domain-containing protein [Gammaproteobacteria bacterium]|nr:DUF2075 domain-containing protein [Gammaproteobacteria bacterium]